jgi:hypothetical protein
MRTARGTTMDSDDSDQEMGEFASFVIDMCGKVFTPVRMLSPVPHPGILVLAGDGGLMVLHFDPDDPDPDLPAPIAEALDAIRPIEHEDVPLIIRRGDEGWVGTIRRQSPASDVGCRAERN